MIVPVLLVAATLVAGCHPTVALHVGSAVSLERRQWEADLTATVNDHTRRLDALEAQKETPDGHDPAPAAPHDPAPAR